MTWLSLLFFIELGFSPFHSTLNITPNNDVIKLSENVFYTTIDIDIMLGRYFFIGGSVTTYVQTIKGDYSFHPFEGDYLVRAGIKYKNIELIGEHECIHPISPYSIYHSTNGSTDIVIKKVYLRIHY